MDGGGALNILGDHHLLAFGALLAGGLSTNSGLVLFDTPTSGLLRYGRVEVLSFCMAFGFGLATIGLATAPISTWPWLGPLFVVGGICLMAWASQALGGRLG